MTNKEAINWIINLSADIGKAEHQDLWHYEQALSEIRKMLESKSEQSDSDDIDWLATEKGKFDDMEGEQE